MMIIWSYGLQICSDHNISGFPQWSIWSIVFELSCPCRLTDEHFFQFCHRKKDLKGLKKPPIWRSRGTWHPTLKGNVSWNWGKTSFPVWLISEPPSSPFHSILPDFGVFLRYVLSQSVTGPTVFETKSFTSPVILQVSFGCDLFEFRSSGISNLDLFFSSLPWGTLKGSSYSHYSSHTMYAPLAMSLTWQRRLQPNVVSYTAAISACVSDWPKGMELLQRLLSETHGNRAVRGY